MTIPGLGTTPSIPGLDETLPQHMRDYLTGRGYGGLAGHFGNLNDVQRRILSSRLPSSLSHLRQGGFQPRFHDDMSFHLEETPAEGDPFGNVKAKYYGKPRDPNDFTNPQKREAAEGLRGLAGYFHGADDLADQLWNSQDHTKADRWGRGLQIIGLLTGNPWARRIGKGIMGASRGGAAGFMNAQKPNSGYGLGSWFRELWNNRGNNGTL